ncbi:MAG: alpha,alpha-trehalase TreF [Cyclobacteriaceae bacterium]|nr:alpha,alpha-trehalase TreF [Cyclobacteriaceae bacterium]
MKTVEIHNLGELFEAVQLNMILGDGKTFPDCMPRYALEEIRKRYAQQKNSNGFDLTHFVHENFELPKAYSTGYQSDVTKPIARHIEELWPILTRVPEPEKSSLIALPHPCVVPGGRFREIYYWDSYFTMLGLRVSNRVDMMQHMVDNFSYLIDNIGYIPNGNRSYFIGRSQSPFFSLMIKLLAAEKGSYILKQYLPYLEKEYRFWMTGSEVLNDSTPALHRVVRLRDGNILNRYWDEAATPRPEAYKEDVELAHQSKQKPEELYRHLRAAAESGWDFSSRWFKDAHAFVTIHTTDIIPVDLNCLMLHLEQTLLEAYQQFNDGNKVSLFAGLVEKRKAAIQKYCWNETENFYFDYDFREEKLKNHFTLASAFPLFFRVATPDQANGVARVLQNKFLMPGGLITTLQFTGQQWDAPNGWAPLQWIAYKGLVHYGFTEVAKRIRTNWMSINKKVYEQTGKMTEKYDVCHESGEARGGEYPNQDGFGWTNGVFLALFNDAEKV